MEKEVGKKAYLFILDAFFALTVLVIGLYLLFSGATFAPDSVQATYSASNLIDYLAKTKIEDTNNAYAGMGGQLWQQGYITNGKNTLLQQIGIFYESGEIAIAQQFIQNLTSNAIPGQYRFEFWIDGILLYPTIQSSDMQRSRNETALLLPSKKIVQGYVDESSGSLYGPYAVEVILWQYSLQ